MSIASRQWTSYLDLYSLVRCNRRPVSTTSAINRGLRATRKVGGENSRTGRSNRNGTGDIVPGQTVNTRKVAASGGYTFTAAKRWTPDKASSPQEESTWADIRRIAELISSIQSAEANGLSRAEDQIRQLQQTLDKLNLALEGQEYGGPGSPKREAIYYMRRLLEAKGHLLGWSSRFGSETADKTVVVESAGHVFQLATAGTDLRKLSTIAPLRLHTPRRGAAAPVTRSPVSPVATEKPTSQLPPRTTQEAADAKKQILRLRQLVEGVWSTSEPLKKATVIQIHSLLQQLGTFNLSLSSFRSRNDELLAEALGPDYFLRVKGEFKDGTRWAAVIYHDQDRPFRLTFNDHGLIQNGGASGDGMQLDTEQASPSLSASSAQTGSRETNINHIRKLLWTIRDTPPIADGLNGDRENRVHQLRTLLDNLGILSKSGRRYRVEVTEPLQKALAKGKGFQLSREQLPKKRGWRTVIQSKDKNDAFKLVFEPDAGEQVSALRQADQTPSKTLTKHDYPQEATEISDRLVADVHRIRKLMLRIRVAERDNSATNGERAAAMARHVTELQQVLDGINAFAAVSPNWLRKVKEVFVFTLREVPGGYVQQGLVPDRRVTVIKRMDKGRRHDLVLRKEDAPQQQPPVALQQQSSRTDQETTEAPDELTSRIGRYVRAPKRPTAEEDDHFPVSLPFTTAASQFLYGANVVLAALCAKRRKLYHLYLQQRSGERHDDIIRLVEEAKVPIHRNASIRMLEKISEGRPHNGVALEASRIPAPPVLSLQKPDQRTSIIGLNIDHQSAEDVAVNVASSAFPAATQTWRHPFVVMLDGITNPENLGNILRSAHFYGVDAVAVAANTCANLNLAILAKASSGACEAVRLLALPKPSKFVVESAKAGWKVYAAVAPAVHGLAPAAGVNRQLTTTGLAANSPLRNDPAILMLGAEGEGLRTNLVRQADHLVSIESGERSKETPDVGVDSLNVGVAAGVLMEAFLRRPAGVEGPEVVGARGRDLGF